jgi:hypothetical protein
MSQHTSDDSDNYGTAVEFSGDETQENVSIKKGSRYRRKALAKEKGITDKQFKKEREQRREQFEREREQRREQFERAREQRQEHFESAQEQRKKRQEQSKSKQQEEDPGESYRHRRRQQSSYRQRQSRQNQQNSYRRRDFGSRSSVVSENFDDVDVLPPPTTIEEWRARFKLMSHNHYPINTVTRANKLLNITPDQVFNKKLKVKIYLMFHPDLSSDPDATSFTQMLNDAIEQLNENNLGRGRNKTRKRRNKTHKRRKNRTKRYGLK